MLPFTGVWVSMVVNTQAFNCYDPSYIPVIDVSQWLYVTEYYMYKLPIRTRGFLSGTLVSTHINDLFTPKYELMRSMNTFLVVELIF